MKKYSEKFISCVLALILFLMPLSCSAASFSYPAGVTESSALNAVSSSDKLISSVLKTVMNTTLKNLLTPVLYGNDTLSGAVKGIYQGLEANSGELKNMGIDVSVKSVAGALSSYPSVSKKLSAYGTWSEVDLNGVNWGVKDKKEFSKALAASLSPFNDVLYALLCSGSIKVSVISVKGGNGYEKSIIPLLKTFDCKDYLSPEEFVKTASGNKNTMVYNILMPFLISLEKMCASPVNSLCKVLPQIAYFINSGKLNQCLDDLIAPVTESSLVKIAVALKLVDLTSVNFDVNKTLDDGLKAISKENGFTLPKFDLALLASCGKTENGGFTSDKGKAFVVIMRYLAELLKNNKDALTGMMKKGTGGFTLPDGALDGITSKDADGIVSMLVSLFTPTDDFSPKVIEYPSQTKTDVTYTANLGESNFKKVLKNIDGIIDEFVKDGGSYSGLGSMLRCSVYTNGNINSAVTGIYSMFEEQGLTEVLGILGIDVSPKGVAACLTENGYSSARNALKNAKSWKKVSLNGVGWNFYDGSRTGFENALTAVLRPLFPILRLLLADKDITLFDSITLKGSNGYDSSVIPLLEALGCEKKSILTYKEYLSYSDTDGVVKEVIRPVFDLLDSVFNKPIDTLTEILPNIVYFMSGNGLETSLNNLLLPVTAFAEKFSGIADFKAETGDLTKKLDIKSLTSSLSVSSGIKLPEFDINTLASLGDLTVKSSKSTVNTEYSYVKADKTAVLVTVLRIFAGALTMEENKNLLSGMAGGGNMGQYSASIGDEFAGKTPDEVIEWLYNLLFKERVKKEIEQKEEYTPNIKYEAPKSYGGLIKAGAIAAAVIIAAVVVVVINRKKIFGEDIVSLDR